MNRGMLTLCAATTGLVALALAGCGQGALGSASTTGANSSAMVVTVGDAPLSNILSAKVTVSALSLTPSGGGSNVTVLSSSRTIELSSLGAIQEPFETENVTAGTYSAINVTVSSATVTYVDSAGSIVTGTATVNSANVTLPLNPVLTVTQGQDVHLSLNFNLAQSFDLTGAALTFTPSITTAAASIEQESEADRAVEVTGSVVSISSTSITVQSAITGTQVTLAINSSTRFSANTSAGSIQQGAIVTVHGAVQPDGTLLATMISASMNGESMGSSHAGGRGIVTAVTADGSGNISSFTFMPREDFGDTPAAMPIAVSLSGSTTYGVSEDALQEGIAPGAFTNAEIFRGQSVQVIGVMGSGNTITASEVDLAPESLSGALTAAPLGSVPNYTFTLQLPAESFLTTYDSLTTLNAATSAQTQYEGTLTQSGFASLAAGTNVEVHGYLLLNGSNYSLTVANVDQVERRDN